MLTDADFKFPPRVGATEHAAGDPGHLDKILAGADREARRTAWEGYMDTYLAYKNTLAGNLLTSIKQNVFSMRARRHASTLEMASFRAQHPGRGLPQPDRHLPQEPAHLAPLLGGAAEGAGRRHAPAVRHLGAADRQPSPRSRTSRPSI